ncbi:MAG: hypothetical protein WDW36_007133 [Sanguina aurantia]
MFHFKSTSLSHSFKETMGNLAGFLVVASSAVNAHRERNVVKLETAYKLFVSRDHWCVRLRVWEQALLCFDWAAARITLHQELEAGLAAYWENQAEEGRRWEGSAGARSQQDLQSLASQASTGHQTVHMINARKVGFAPDPMKADGRAVRSRHSVSVCGDLWQQRGHKRSLSGKRLSPSLTSLKEAVTPATSRALRLAQAPLVRGMMFTWSTVEGVVESALGLQQAVSAAVQRSRRPAPHQATSFVPPVLKTLAATPFWTYMQQQLGSGIPASLSSSAALKASLSNRVVQPPPLALFMQAILKYQFTQAGMLTLLLVLGNYFTLIRGSTPLFAWIASSAVLSEKVEATASRLVIRLAATVVGASLGFLVMFDARLAGTPAAIAAILCLCGALATPVANSPYRLAVVITFVSLMAVTLCQYKGCCDSPGSVTYYVTRMVCVSAGAILPSLLSQAILPWYLSAWAMETLAEVYVHSLSMITACCEASYLQAKDRAAQGLLYGCASEQCRRTQGSSGAHGDLLSPSAQHPITVREGNNINNCNSSNNSNNNNNTNCSNNNNRSNCNVHAPSSVQHTLAPPQELTAGKDTAGPVGCLSHAGRDPGVVLQASASGAPLAAVSATRVQETRPGQPAGPARDVATLHGRDPAHTAAAPSWVATRSGILLTPPPSGAQPQSPTGTFPLRIRLLLRVKHAWLCCCPKASSRAAEPAVQHAPAAAEPAVPSRSLSAGPAFDAALKDLEQSIQQQLRVDVTNKLSAVKASLVRDSVLWTRGAYVTPQAVHNMAAVLQVLADRLAALELSLHVQPTHPHPASHPPSPTPPAVSQPPTSPPPAGRPTPAAGQQQQSRARGPSHAASPDMTSPPESAADAQPSQEGGGVVGGQAAAPKQPSLGLGGPGACAASAPGAAAEAHRQRDREQPMGQRMCWSYVQYAAPMHAELLRLMELLTTLANTTAEVMSQRPARVVVCDGNSPAKRLTQLLLQIEQHRLQHHWHFHRLRHEMHEACPHDMIAFLSTRFALTKVVDACMAVARTAEAMHCQSGQSWTCWVK